MKSYRVHVHDHADQGRWLAQADFAKRPDRAAIEAAMPMLNEPGRYEVRVCLVQGDTEMVAGNWLQGEPWFRENDGWSIKGYGADPGWHVSDEALRETPREDIEKLFSLGQAGGLPQLPDAAWAAPACETCGCPQHDPSTGRSTHIVKRESGYVAGWFHGEPPEGFVEECNANVPGDPAHVEQIPEWPTDGPFGVPSHGPNADGNPYAQYTPENRVWAVAQENGKAAAAWIFDGNTTQETYRNMLAGIEDGDPAVLDGVREPSLSGEYGDDYSEDQLMADAGWVPHDGTNLRDELAHQYNQEVSAAFWHEVERLALAALG